MIGPAPLELDPWDTTNTNAADNTDNTLWRERERRQRTVRFLMMFMLMLLLMDGEDNPSNPRLRRKKKTKPEPLETSVFVSRQAQEARIRSVATRDGRYKRLVQKNNGVNHEQQVHDWARLQLEQEKDEFFEVKHHAEPRDPVEALRVWTYPWNATGYYRGEWKSTAKDDTSTQQSKAGRKEAENASHHTDKERVDSVNAQEIEDTMLDIARERGQNIGVYFLPEGKELMVRDDHNYTSMRWEQWKMDQSGNLHEPDDRANEWSDLPPKLSLTNDQGGAAFQLYSRPIPTMKELSLVDGFVKVYDSNSVGYSTAHDILLRVRGVLIHSIGKLSLVSSGPVGASALVIGNHTANSRRLEEETLTLLHPDRIRDLAIALFHEDGPAEAYKPLLQSADDLDRHWFGQRHLLDKIFPHSIDESNTHSAAASNSESVRSEGSGYIDFVVDRRTQQVTREKKASWSDVVLPFPFVRDDKDESIRRVKTPASRPMPAREQKLELNAYGCHFEINADVDEVEWSVGAWRKLVHRKVLETKMLDPSSQGASIESTGRNIRGEQFRPSKARSKTNQDQALVVNLLGTISSTNCHFMAELNVTAVRTDWDATTTKVINYSFYMMLVCLIQIVILLRQLLHSQAQSTAVRVSILCVGWQTVVDALVCLAHIYLSLAMQPLFTAFASVAFFKLLIFCVIEMKYMSMIIQARNNSNGGESAEVLRRQVTMLHLRFYVALFIMFLLLFYIGESYRTIYVLVLYSYWVPQIVLNVITEAKHTLHSYYIYGMSITRLVMPVYILAVPNNFLKEVYTEAKTDHLTCYMLVLWMGVQTAVLIAQGKYGARFMIPQRFLPPKFDYHREIPASLMPTIVNLDSLAPPLRDEDDCEPLLVNDASSPGRHSRHVTAPRNRRGMRSDNRLPTETVAELTLPPVTLDCSICYEAIDVRHNQEYMLAPCDHLFHRECLSQWMDVKMECPICRKQLPAL